MRATNGPGADSQSPRYSATSPGTTFFGLMDQRIINVFDEYTRVPLTRK